ncbi:MAG: hypothetical protein ACLFNU_04770 [Bacteroidales bacterium]
MRKLTLIPLLAASLLLVFGCGSKEKKSESDYESTFTPMEVEIPAELKDNPEAVEFVNNMAEAVDAYALALDKVAGKIHEMGLEEGEEPSTMQKIKLVQVLASHFQDIAKYAEPLEEYYSKSDYVKGEMSDAEMAAFSSIMDRFHQRMMEMEKKYENLSSIAGQP